MEVPLLDLKAQYISIKDEIISAIEEVCESQLLCLGPAVTAFEEQISAYCESKYSIGVSSGSDALLLSLMTIGINPGDEVITSSFTFFATAGAISRLGARPVFVDVDEDSFNINPSEIEAGITEKTKVIIPVHLFGQITQMKPIVDIAQRNGLCIIEDACQSIGASQDGIKAGNFGDFGCFSFYPSKNLGGFGDGGLVTTNSKDLAKKSRLLRTHGQTPTYFYKMIGGNFRLDSIQAAVLTVKLKYLDEWSKKRRANAAIYNELFANTIVQNPTIAANNLSVYNNYTIKVPERDKLHKYLEGKGISTAIFYPKPLHLQECFKDLGYKEGALPVVERLCNEVLSIPVYPELTSEQIEYTANCILEFYN